MLESPLASPDGSAPPPYLAFDLDPERVAAGRKAGFKVLFGDATRSAVLRAAGVECPRAVVVAYPDPETALQAVANMRAAFPSVTIYACAADLRHAAELAEAGADDTVIRSVEAGLALGARLLGGLGASGLDLAFLKRGIEESVAARTRALAGWLQHSGDSVPPAFSSLDMLVLTAEVEDFAREAAAAAAAAAAERDAAVAAALCTEAAQPGTPLTSAASSSSSSSAAAASSGGGNGNSKVGGSNGKGSAALGTAAASAEAAALKAAEDEALKAGGSGNGGDGGEKEEEESRVPDVAGVGSLRDG
ncbi:hypothetical protein Agub_g15057 [Astrephomene gubernaculifera]|uniref:RCK N-terminal domain-containing protein n=1 Tax=Astrephomene gubernaculifera TaxID=47775 RepID=A0AAD3E456_9CHLO|nr:hypothetical protein Agub_g15057 [Astrephomene gubernaculifera]